MKKFLIFGGGFISGNLGVDAITLGTIRAVRDEFPGAEFICLDLISKMDETIIQDINFSGEWIKVEEFTTSVKAGIKCLIEAYLPGKTDNSLIERYLSVDGVIDINGGDRFGETYGNRRLFSSNLGKLIAFSLKKPLAIFPQTIGPFNTAFGKNLARYVLRRSDLICVREKVSQSIVNALVKPGTPVYILADMAFLMPKAEISELPPSIINKLKDGQIGINASSFMQKRSKTLRGSGFDYIDIIIEIAKTFVEDYNKDVLLIPHVSEDNSICRYLKEKINSPRVSLVDVKLTAPQAKAVISSNDFFIGSRMHSCIAALSTATPLVAIAYSHKYIGIMKRFGLEDCVLDPSRMSKDEMIKSVFDAYSSRSDAKDRITKELPNVSADARKAAQLFAELINA